MIDPKLVEKTPQKVIEMLSRRNAAYASDHGLIASMGRAQEDRRALITRIDENNRRVKEISNSFRGLAEDMRDVLAEQSRAITAETSRLKTQLKVIDDQLEHSLLLIPNLPADDVPAGGEEHNIELRRWGITRSYAEIEGFAIKDHVALGEAMGLMDFEAATKMSGSRFVVLRGALARMERALATFMLDHLADAGFVEHVVPHIVNGLAVKGTGQWPTHSEDMYLAETGHTTLDGMRYFIPTSEVSLTNLVRESILEDVKLPMKLCASTPCYRSEAGSAGRDTRGMIRQHQFQKVEMVAIAHPKHSEAMHDFMLRTAETILKNLGLPYRVVLLAAGDMGFAAQKTYDLEVWLPSQDCYREISSISNCGDFQARRMNARFKGASQSGTTLVHTLNGSALAVGRTLVAIMENYQKRDGSIEIPPHLRPYMNGKVLINADGSL